MTNHGKVQTFNRMTGTGFISPEDGGELLPFRQIDVYRNVGDEVQERQRFRYEVDFDAVGERQAVILHSA